MICNILSFPFQDTTVLHCKLQLLAQPARRGRHTQETPYLLKAPVRNCTFRQQIASIKQKASGQKHRRLFAALLCDPGDGEEIHPSTQESPKESTASLSMRRQTSTLLHRAAPLTCVSSKVCLEMRTLRIGFATACIVTSVGGRSFPGPRPSSPLWLGLLWQAGTRWHEL